MTYALFLLFFVVPPSVLLAIYLHLRGRLTRRLGLALLATAIIAVVYTGPWDSTIISQGVWSYPPGRVIGPTIASDPVTPLDGGPETFALIGAGALLAAIVLLVLRGRSRIPDQRPAAAPSSNRTVPRGENAWSGPSARRAAPSSSSSPSSWPPSWRRTPPSASRDP